MSGRWVTRHALPLAILLTAASPRDGCGGGNAPYEPCAGKSCGMGCTLCPPGDPNCVEIQVIKACDPQGACVSTAFTCPMPNACAGLACGDTCAVSVPCLFSFPVACTVPIPLGHCDITGQCVEGDYGSCAPAADCVGRACGETCNPCSPPQSCPTLIPSACDPWGRCVGSTPGLCDCVGAACGDPCRQCEAVCIPESINACDGIGHCLPVGAGVGCSQ